MRQGSLVRHTPVNPSGVFDFDLASCWLLDGSPEEVVALFHDPMSLTHWWSEVFMRGEMLSGCAANGTGLTARFYTKGLLPHTFQFTARIQDANAPKAVQIRTWGDFDGRCDIFLAAQGDKTRIDIRWQVNVCQPYIRALLGVGRPIFIANHRWAMRRGRLGLQAAIFHQRRKAEKQYTPPRRPTFPHNLALFKDRFRWSRDAIDHSAARVVKHGRR
ncbi:MAG: hypothetical protein NXH91_03505 [Phyllobacteriaceae bacterium]|nr:hypothetical protein [Phyllobacteriaceae bacterium]